MREGSLFIEENIPLGDFTTFGIGGSARYFISVTGEEQLGKAAAFARETGLPLFVLGGGSNILISDKGFPGLVIRNRIPGFEHRRSGGHVYVTAGAGEDWDGIVRRCVEQGWQGLEGLSGVPGTAGAAPVQNIGAYGQSAGSSITGVRALDTQTGSMVSFSAGECEFGYRGSIFNSAAAGRYIISSVTFRLVIGGIPSITYHDLNRYLHGITDPTPAKVREAVLDIRNAKGLLIMEGRESFRSAGSFFKNPVIPGELFEQVEREVANAGGCEHWAWPLDDETVKVSAACLIRRAGYERGYRRGSVGLSPRHTLIIVNNRDAKADDVIAFARELRDRVLEKFNVALRPEVQLVGFGTEGILS